MDNLRALPLIFSSGMRPLGKNRAWKAMHRLEKILLTPEKEENAPAAEGQPYDHG
jgi:hypothetical protein